jgi:hypothetical protein
MRLLLAAVCLSLLPAAAGASDFTRNAVGTMGSEFLLMDQGARGIAMGGAYSAVTNDAASIYWNPAGLTRVPRLSAMFSYTRYVQGVTYQSGYVATRLNDTSVLAGGYRYRDVGPIDQTDINGGTLGTFNPRDYVAEAAWGQSILDLSDSEVDVTMGVTGRIIHSDYIAKADAFGGDIGIQSRFYTSRHAYDLSFVAQNIGKGQQFDQRRDPMPFQAKLGAAISVIKPLTLSMEAFMPSGNIVHGAGGMEYTMELAPQVQGAARAGFNSLTMDTLGVVSGLTFGWGVKVNNLSFDYAFVPMGPLGTDTHRVTLSFNLPAKISRRYRER